MVEARVAVGAPKPDRELLPRHGVGKERIELVAKGRARPKLRALVHPSPRDDVVAPTKRARGAPPRIGRTGRLGGAASARDRVSVMRQAAAIMMKAIRATASRLTRSLNANLIGSSSIRRRSAMISARPIQYIRIGQMSHKASGCR